ncbi:MAG: N-acyl-D-amino acid deacylase, partial [Pontibacter sp.]|nr:N-acyl-D-amino acid deacylase [Pontibacter sp.]
GLLKPGYKADLLVFNPADVKENATYEKPDQLATGFRYVLIGGQVAKDGDNYTDGRLGKVLRKNKTE